MAASPRIGLQQRQKLTLSPAMRVSLDLLRLPTEALIEEILREGSDNPFLDVHLPANGALDAAQAMAAAEESLLGSVLRQIGLQRLSPAVRTAAAYLAGQLRDDGYLDGTLDEIAEESGLAPADLAAGLAAIQMCEPAGVGARSLAECLALQLAERGYARDRADAIVARLGDFAAGRTTSLMRALGMNRVEIEATARVLHTLAATPVAPETAPPAPRVAELMVTVGPDGTPHAALNPDALPQVAFAAHASAAADSAGLAECHARALRLTRGLAARAATLLRVGQHIVARQEMFFRARRQTIHPESRAAAAAALGLHPSTLGRAIAGTALAFDGQSHALCGFFSPALPSSEGPVSARDVQSRIRALISAESRTHPLADEDICTQLRKEGVDIARRTVAKYRKCMRIPSSFARRQRSPDRAPGPDPRTAR
jgi:RNA polymerase sigma-54 factor